MMALPAFAEYAAVDGHRVYYETAGRGEPAVVLVHGWTCDLSFWSAQRQELAKRHQVLLIDLPGHGRSDKPQINYDLALFSRSVRGVMDKAKVSRAVLMGHSMGGGVIRQVYEDDPGRVIALVSVDGVVLANPSDSLVKQITDLSATMRGPSGPDVRRKFIEGMFTDATTPELRKKILSAMLAAPEHVAASALLNTFTSPLWNNPAPVKVPVLALNKVNRENRIRQSHERAFANLEYHELDNTSHFLQMEAPDRFNPVLLAFLERVSR
jgi:pimeloyl-ACP methyl ester carboxylesterase